MEMFVNYPDVVSVKQLMEMLHIGRSKAYELLQTDTIHHVKVGSHYIIPKKNVIAFLGITA